MEKFNYSLACSRVIHFQTRLLKDTSYISADGDAAEMETDNDNLFWNEKSSQTRHQQNLLPMAVRHVVSRFSLTARPTDFCVFKVKSVIYLYSCPSLMC